MYSVCLHTVKCQNNSISNNSEDERAMTMIRCFALTKSPVLLEPHHQIVSCPIKDTHSEVVLPLFRSAVGVFNSPKRLGKRISWDHPNYSMVEISQKSLGDMRRLAVTKTPVKNHQLPPVWETLKWLSNTYDNNNGWSTWNCARSLNLAV